MVPAVYVYIRVFIGFGFTALSVVIFSAGLPLCPSQTVLLFHRITDQRALQSRPNIANVAYKKETVPVLLGASVPEPLPSYCQVPPVRWVARTRRVWSVTPFPLHQSTQRNPQKGLSLPTQVFIPRFGMVTASDCAVSAHPST